MASETDLNFSDGGGGSAAPMTSSTGSVRGMRVGGTNISRRMSGMTILSSYEIKSTFPITDESTLAKFEALMDQFPKPPNNLEPNFARNSTSSNNSANTGTKQGGWGLKGFAERFSLFSKG